MIGDIEFNSSTYYKYINVHWEGLIKNLGMTLFNEYVVPFEISSVLFLSAMVGAVVMGKKE